MCIGSVALPSLRDVALRTASDLKVEGRPPVGHRHGRGRGLSDKLPEISEIRVPLLGLDSERA